MAWQSTLEATPNTSPIVFEDELVNTSQVLAFIGISRPTLEKAIKEGRFPSPMPFSRNNRWSKRVIMEWVQEQSTAANSSKKQTPEGQSGVC